jgi:hypothetical protein
MDPAVANTTNGFKAAISGTIVYHDNLNVVISLLEYAINSLTQQGARIIDRHDDRY